MNKYDLSVLIPARNEMFLANTVADILRNIRGNTEVIVFLDGKWADPGIPDDDRVTIIYSPVSIGQRAATNQACRLSRAKYVMKLDAHCALDEGFDVKMMSKMEEDITMIPLMRNLHAFDWVCVGKDLGGGNKQPSCGRRLYQCPSPESCSQCGGKMKREIMWIAKRSPRSTAFRFDKTLHFQYWNDFKNRPEGKGDLTPTMSIQGSCFMLTRKKFWELKISDEAIAGKSGWGQQGVEVALKTWLSGGRVLCNQDTWYAHMFRTQGGDFGFPYPLSGNEVNETREKSRKLFIENNWPLAIMKFEDFLKKFYPIPDWHHATEKLSEHSAETENVEDEKRNIIFYTDNQLRLKFAHAVQKQLKNTRIPIVSSSLKPMPHFGQNIHIPQERGMETYFKQIIAALEASKAEIVYMCEHDVLYHPSHFEFVPPTETHFYYNLNFWRIRPEVDKFAVHWDAPQVSGLVAYRKFLLQWYKNRWEQIQKEGFNRSYEPGGRDSELKKVFRSKYPNIDIRHGGTLTRSKWSPADFRDKSTCVNWQETTADKIPGWDYTEIERLFDNL